MRTLLRGLIIPIAGLMLTACGGGSSSGTSEGGGAFEPPGGLGPDERIEFQVTRTELPANVSGVPVFVGSPYIAEIKATVLESDGSIVPNGSVVNFNVFPTEVGLLTTPDDPETTDINEFTDVFLESGTSETNSGQIAIFFHALERPGTATVRVSYDDPELGTISGSTQITVVESGSTLLPETVSVNRSSDFLYVQGSGGRNRVQVEAAVEDGGSEPVPDPEGFNNVQVNLVNEGPSLGASLSGTNASGGAVSGNQIRIPTTNGRATFSVRSGSQTGTQSVRVTADGADNNVDNGIGTPVTNQFQVSISDGRLHSLTITSPNVNTVRINRVDPTVEIEGDSEIPPDPDGTYSLTVSALANDRGGNPVIPGTAIQFGLIDSPITGFPLSGPGLFDISGSDGDPTEGGIVFNSPGGAFNSAGGGAGPGDTVALFGDDAPPGNTDHESTRVVDSVQNDRILRVTKRFNDNDTTGSSVDNGPVIPYVVGRAEHGNIGNSAPTDENGVATLKMNYPMSRVGQIAVIWAQGNAGTDNGADETAADVATVAFPGVAPVFLSAAPSQLPANSPVDVLVCAQDALSVPLRGIGIGFNVLNPQGATVTVDGTPTSGTVQPATGGDGCTTATVDSTGVSETTEPINIQFFVGGASATVQIVPPGNTVLQAIPNLFFGDGFKEVLLRYLDAGGNPIPGVQIGVTCESDEDGSANVIDPPGVTDENGETTATIDATVDNIGEAGTAECTFFPAGGPPPEALVQFIGFDICLFSPQPAGCAAEENGGG